MRDLFGEVPVTWPEVAAWCEAVAGIAPDSPRFALYVRAYDVPGKVAAAKVSGEFESILSSEAPEWPSRLARIAQETRGRRDTLGYSRRSVRSAAAPRGVA